MKTIQLISKLFQSLFVGLLAWTIVTVSLQYILGTGLGYTQEHYRDAVSVVSGFVGVFFFLFMILFSIEGDMK